MTLVDISPNTKLQIGSSTASAHLIKDALYSVKFTLQE